jgi:hydrogenase maturation factor
LEFGKARKGFLRRVVLRSLGAASRAVLIGPGLGLDNAFVSAGRGRVMAVTADPVSIIPGVEPSISAWLSVHLIASDYTTSGLQPEFATFTFNLPGDLENSKAEAYLKAIGSECKRLNVAIVAGHTGSYPGAGYTVVGGGSMLGFCRRGEYVDPTMARAGDAIVMTKGAAIEAAAMLARSFPRFVEGRVGHAQCRRARLLLGRCSTVTDATVAASAGLGTDGITSMHDATEGGVLGGLGEMADAAGKAFVVQKESIHVPAEVQAVCAAFGIDPLSSESEGTLLLTCHESALDGLQGRLRRRGIEASPIGRVMKGSGLWLSGGKGAPARVRPESDGYWRAYEESLRSGLS